MERRSWVDFGLESRSARGLIVARLLRCSLFRVIPADVYLDNFASDRSHMVSRLSSSPCLVLALCVPAALGTRGVLGCRVLLHSLSLGCASSVASLADSTVFPIAFRSLADVVVCLFLS